MLVRQNILLEFLRQAGRPVTKLELVKWAFVFRQDMSRDVTSFYDFLPYHYGPYSFSLAREVEGLVQDGWIADRGHAWELVRFPELESRHARDVAKVVKQFGNCDQDVVIDYVYERSPEFTVNSRRKKLAERKVADPKVYTAGYEGLQIDGFLNLLVQRGIERLIDVRSNPVARRFGFHRSTLARLCGLLGIEYQHQQTLGIRSELRRSLETDMDYERLFEHYSETTLLDEQHCVEIVAEEVRSKASVLVCMEANPARCHRSFLARNISEMTHLPIVDLGQSQ